VPDVDQAAAIRRGVTRLSSRLRAERPAGSLTGNKLTVLSHLHRKGPATAGDVAAAAHQQPQSLTRTFNELALAGLVTRRTDERDRRATVLTITEAGTQALFDDMAVRDRWLVGALDVLTPTEVALLQLASGLLERLAELPDDQRSADAAVASRSADAAVASRSA
jgi:DNA-binding MarR family transcriptional regulator